MIGLRFTRVLAVFSILFLINLTPLFYISGQNSSAEPYTTSPVPGSSEQADLGSSNAGAVTIPDKPVMVYLLNRVFDPLVAQHITMSTLNSELISVQPSEYKLIQFDGPVEETWKERAAEEGVTLLSYIPDYTFMAKVPMNNQAGVSALPFVRWMGDFLPLYKLEPGLLETFQFDFVTQELLLGPSGTYMISLFDTNSDVVDEFKTDIADMGADFITTDLDLALINGLAEVELTVEQLHDVISWPEVAWVQPTAELVTHMHKSARILGVRQEVDGGFDNDGTSMWSYDPSTNTYIGYPGSNATVAVVDTGVDGSHPAFDGRKEWFKAYNWAGQWGDVANHGTHVAGIVLGNGEWRFNDPSPGTNGKYAGIAPNASLIGQAYLGSGSSVATVMYDAATHGADISTNSWGYRGSYWFGKYEGVSAAYDRFVRDSGDGIPVTVTFSAGNDGPTSGSVSPPATAKNIICVGSTDDNDGNKISGFSARGPLEDGRLKPDLVTPGAGVTSARGNSAYSYVAFSGTSMAAPAAAGGAAVVIDYYKTNYDYVPSPALVKAILVNGAEPMPGLTWPDDNQGWGRMNLPNSLFETEHKKFLYYDQLERLNTNEEVTYEFNVAEKSNLKLHLVWTDEDGSPNAAKALVNDLDMIVRSPEGDTYYGNQFYLGQSIPGGSPDNTNNVEGFAMQNTPEGKWEVTIRGKNVPQGPQDFVLFISGPVWEDMLDVSAFDLFSDKGEAVFQGEPVVLNGSIRNSGTLRTIGSQYVLTDYQPDGTSRKLEVDILEETLPGEFFNFSIDWSAEQLGIHRLVLALDPLNAYEETNETNNIFEILVTVNTFGVKLIKTEPDLVLDAGVQSDLRLQVHNTGTVNDSYMLQVENLPPGWSAVFNQTEVHVPVSSYRNVTLQLTVPAGVAAGIFDGLEITANSSRAPSFKSEQSLSLEISEYYSFEFTTTEIDLQIIPGGSALFKVPVRNTGNTDMLVKPQLITEKLSPGWELSYSTEELLVPYNGSVSFSVELKSPTEVLAGETEAVPLTMELVPHNGEPEIIYSVEGTCTLNAMVQQFYDFQLDFRRTSFDVEAGKNTRVEFTVENKGNGRDTFTFDAYTPSQWPFSFSPGSVTLEPFDTADIKLNVNVPVNEHSGEFELAVKARSVGEPTKTCGKVLELVLKQDYNLKLVVENPVIVVPIGGTVIMPLHIINNGNGDDTASLRVNWFEDIVHFTSRSVFVSERETVQTDVVLHIPDTFTPSNRTIEFLVISGDNKTIARQEIMAIITAPYVPVDLPGSSTDQNGTAGAGVDEKAYGLFGNGWFFDIFVLVLIVVIVILILFMLMVSFDKKPAVDTSAKSNGYGRIAGGAPGSAGAVMREVKVVRHRREITTRKVQKRRRISSRQPVPLLEAEIVQPEADTGEAEHDYHEVDEPADETGAEYDPEPVDESETNNHNGNNNGNGSGGWNQNSFVSIFVIFLIIMAGFGAMIAFDIGTEPAAGFSFGGSIDVNTTWSENMTITGDTTIEEGVTLYILPGVNVWFKSSVRFYVKGTLYANGTEGNLINFTSSSNNPWKGIWNRIQLRSTASGRMNYCNISYAVYGTDFYGADYFTVENTSYVKNRYAVYMRSNSNYNTFKNNTMFDNGWGYGLYISYCKYNTFENNSLAGNTYNFYITGNSKAYFTHYFINDSNKAEGKPMYYWLDRSDETVPEDAGFVGLVGSTNITVANMEIRKSGEGIVFAYTNLSRINNVTLRNNNYGIYFYQAGEDNLITNVTAYSNAYGLYFNYAYNNKLRDNSFKDNTYNVYFVGSSLKYFEHDIDTSNLVQDNKPMIYWVDRHYETVPSNAGFVALVGSTNITVSGVSVRKNAQGILIAHSDNIEIENIYLNKNYYATYFTRTTGKITMANSTVYDNRCGGYFYRGHDTEISSTVYDTNYDAFIIRDTKRLELTNCSIIASSRWNIDTATGSTTTLLNTTFNPNKVKIKDANTELTVKWFMNIRAVNDLGVPVQFRVIVRDGNNNVVTDRNVFGSLYWTQCVGYRQTPTKIFYEYNNYTAEARNATTALVRELNMTYSRTVEFVFNAKPYGILPEFLEFEEDGWLELDLSAYFSDYNKLTYTTYIFQNLEVDLDNAQELANITATPDWCGSGSITIRVIDEHGAYIESTAWINVISVNDAPRFARPVPHIYLTEGVSSYSFDLADHIYDPDWSGCGDVVKWYIEGEDPQAVTITGENSTSTLLELDVIDSDYYGAHKLQLYLEDSEGAVTSRDLWLNITARNDAPELSSGTVSPLRGDTDTAFEFSVVYTDTDGDLPGVVQLVLDGVGYTMTEQNSSDIDTTDGKIYDYQGMIVDTGAHEFSFGAMDKYRVAGYSISTNGLFVDEPVRTTGDVSGFVLDSSYELGLEGAVIALFHGLNGTPVPNGTTSAGAHGEFQFVELQSGIYSLEFQMMGYHTYTIDSLLVNPGEVMTDGLTVKLTRDVPHPEVPKTDTDITGVDIELSSDSTEPQVGDTVTFNGSAVDLDGDELIFYWDFGDESSMPVGSDQTHNYTSEGTFNITLTVLDSDGNTASVKRAVTIKPAPIDPNGNGATDEQADDKYGSTMWLAGIFICVALLCVMIPIIMLYTRRRKRAQAAARKLKVLKKQMMLKAAANVHTARMMGSGRQGAVQAQMQQPQVHPYPQLTHAAALHTRTDVPAPTPIPRPALPPTPEPVVEPAMDEIAEADIMVAEIAEVPEGLDIPEGPEVVESEDILKTLSLPGDDEEELVLDFKRPKKR